MKKVFQSLFFLAIVALVAVGCKKKEEEVPATPTPTELLTAKSWKLTAHTLVAFGSTVDEYASLPACEKDDLEVYKTDFKFEANEGATKCNPSDPQVSATGTWAFESNNTRLRVTVGTDVDLYDVVELTATTLKLKLAILDHGVTYTTNYTYAAQ